MAAGSADASMLAVALADAELAGEGDGAVDAGLSVGRAGEAQAASKSGQRMIRTRCIRGMIDMGTTVAARGYGQTAACAICGTGIVGA